jgi:MoxR-like ATPase
MMTNNKNTSDRKLKYEGIQYQDENISEFSPYIPDDNLKEAVNLAIDLNRGLILEGAPGCGKTRLAEAIAHEFTREYPELLKDLKEWPIYTWNVKSTERARDGLYTFDGVARLRDAQLISSGGIAHLPPLDQENLLINLKDETKSKYIKYGALGTVLKEEFPAGVRPILLIDEIDKADSDFPNDLLLEIDRLKFEVKEMGKTYSKEKSNSSPIIIITSNRERPLSEPFLRRCLYYYVDFPKPNILEQIIQSHFRSTTKYPNLIPATRKKVEDIRKILEEYPGSKLPGTSEILNLVEALNHYLNQSDALNEADALKELENLATRLPLLGIVLKTQQDWQNYRQFLGVVEEDRDED